MEPITYAITLKAPAFLRVVEYDGAAKRAYLSAVAVRSKMRRMLKLLIDEYGLSTELEFELFGELRPDGYTRASVFQISEALTESDVSAPNGDEKYGRIVLPTGTTLIGHLLSKVPNNSPEGLAILMSLIGIRSLNEGINSSSRDCEITVNTSSIDLEKIYTSDCFCDRHAERKAAERWLPIVHRAIIDFFAGRPEEMQHMPSRDFEKLIAELLRREGFEVFLTPETRDGGYDILALRHQRVTGDEVFLVECKRYARSRKISVGMIRSLIGVVQLGNVTKGMLVTTSQLTGPAKTLVTANSSRLMVHEYETLVEWLNSICSIKKG